MKRFFSLTLGLLAAMASQAADTIYTKAPQIPILLERNDNVLFYMRMDAKDTKTLDEVSITFDKNVPLSAIKSVKLYYSGTEAPQDRGKKRYERYAPVEYISSHTPGKTLAANPSYSIKKDECQPTSHTLTLKGNQNLFPGINFFWVSLEMQPNTNLNTPITAEITQAVADGKINPVKDASESPVTRRLGVGVRHAGDDGSAAFRIPGLVTTNKGTLLGVYDVRYNSSVDLQEHIDIGLSRSTDGGQTWEKMRLPLSFGEYDGLPSAQNGVGDPSILVDTKTNTIWVVAAWTHVEFTPGNGPEHYRSTGIVQKYRRRKDLVCSYQYHRTGKETGMVFPAARTGTRHHHERRDIGIPYPVHRQDPHSECRYHV